jgi:RNA polymerase sigma factor (sigma-70 family)
MNRVGVSIIGRMQADGFRDLVRQAQAGDAQALERLFGVALPYVERIVRDPVRKSCPDDRVQDVCKRILEKLNQFRGAENAPDDQQAWALFCGWVRQIVHSVTVNAARKTDGPKPPYKKVPLQGPAAGDSSNQPGVNEPPGRERTPSSNVRASERARLVLHALHKLPDPKNREIVRLRFFECLSLKQISERLDLSYDIVRERFRVSMQRLARELEGLQ